MQYSVSPRCTLSSLGPKPSENVMHAHAVPARQQEVAQLVNEHEHAEHEQKRKQRGHGLSLPQTFDSNSRASFGGMLPGPGVDAPDLGERRRRLRRVRIHRLLR